MNLQFAESYSDHCNLQQTIARQAIQSTTFRRENYERIIDAGCGTGEVTNILIERFPNAKEIYAFDKAPEMIKVARERNQNIKISYNVGSIDDVESLSSNQVNSTPREFNLFTSFFVIHWVQDQSKALTTVKTTLAPGGEFLITSVMNAPLLTKTVHTLAQMPKWAEYLANFVPQWTFSPGWESNNKWKIEPASGYKQLCEDAGMEVISSKITPEKYYFDDDEELKSLLQWILPHLSVIPRELQTEFLADAFEVYNKYSERDEQGRLPMYGDVLCVHGFKKSSNVPDELKERVSYYP